MSLFPTCVARPSISSMEHPRKTQVSCPLSLRILCTSKYLFLTKLSSELAYRTVSYTHIHSCLFSIIMLSASTATYPNLNVRGGLNAGGCDDRRGCMRSPLSESSDIIFPYALADDASSAYNYISLHSTKSSFHPSADDRDNHCTIAR